MIRAAAIERELTVREVAELLRRAPKTIRNLIYAHRLKRRRIHLGRKHKPALLIPPETVEALRARIR